MKPSHSATNNPIISINRSIKSISALIQTNSLIQTDVSLINSFDLMPNWLMAVNEINSNYVIFRALTDYNIT